MESVGRTAGKLAVVHEANTTGGFGAEVVTRVAEASALRHRPTRIAIPDTRVPAAPELAAALVPYANRISAALDGHLAG